MAFLVGWFKSLGYRRIVVRSDNRRALLALLQRVSRVLDGVEWIPRTSPEGDPQANGLSELGVREIKKQCRVLISQLEARLRRRLRAEEPIFAWIPRNSAKCMRLGASVFSFK